MIDLILAAALKGTLLLGVAWLICRLTRGAGADLRHLVWLGALIAMALLLVPLPVTEPASFAVVAGGMEKAVRPASMASLSVRTLLLYVWGTGAALLAMRMIVSHIGLARITRRAQLAHDNVYASNSVSTPLTWGFLRPVVLLPSYAFEWSAEQRERAMRHEQAHIRRNDWLWQTFAQVMTCVFWFHPLVWLAAARLRTEADDAADNAVLDSGADAADYASQLLEVARHYQPVGGQAAVGMVRTPNLGGRIASILDPRRRSVPSGKFVRSAIMLATVAVVLPLAAYQNEPVYKVGEQGVTAPTIVNKVDPDYTQSAKDARIEGTVGLKVVIEKSGRAGNIEITRSLDKGLDESAIAAIRQWSFVPGKKDGDPVATVAVIEVNFRLQ